MADSFGKRLWNLFRNRDPTKDQYEPFRSPDDRGWWEYGMGSSLRQDRAKLFVNNQRTIIASIYNRIAIDAAAIRVQHVRLGENDTFKEVIKDELNEILTLQANIDQTSRAFIQDVVMSMFDEGHVVIVPTITDHDPEKSSYKIHAVRCGRVVTWYPYHVLVRLYNELSGLHEDIMLEKEKVAIIENPLYAVMNERNSTLSRLNHKLNLLDVLDEKVASGKLDLIIQLPYEIRTPNKREQAETRRKDIELQLAGSQYGIAYMGATERITQLNRPAENQLMAQVKDLQAMLFGQLGITEEIMLGTATEEAMINYFDRTIEPILAAITLEMKRKFLTRTAITQGQSIEFFRDPFRLVPLNSLAEIMDKLTRNEILSSNEGRAIIGFKPIEDPRADELRNKNITAEHDQLSNGPMTTQNQNEGEEPSERR